MQKLIELLNEFEEKRIDKINSEWKLFVKLSFRPYTESAFKENSVCAEIISKYYGFIKRLVDNDKINIDKYYEFMTNENIDISSACWELDMDKEFYYELLMILAVQENSIEFLISILK